MIVLLRDRGFVTCSICWQEGDIGYCMVSIIMATVELSINVGVEARFTKSFETNLKRDLVV